LNCFTPPFFTLFSLSSGYGFGCADVKAPAYRKRWGERYGFYRQPLKPGGIMLHSVSVGETLAVPLVRALRHRYPDLPITVTTMTPTGSERVQSAWQRRSARLSAV
jgi:3-deoxy-D-manno-octulosonic-acid transferase